MIEEDFSASDPEAPTGAGASAIDRARRAISDAGYWNANQQMGRRWPIGCVALEITQRCNLDCTLCYLSENSEAVRDVPIEEVFRRIDLIHHCYGRNTDVQITGGDPTLRKRDELLAIVRRVRALGMRPTLMTNGIRATRPLLAALAEAGLVDVAFHVDTTQRRKGYDSEAGLNEVRRAYIERARGLPLSVLFNTTVHRGNFHEIPDLVRFFRVNAGAVRTAAFQLAADAGRGMLGMRVGAITADSVIRKIAEGAEASINFGASFIGHPACSRYGMGLVANGVLFDAFDDSVFIGRMLAATAHIELHRNDASGVATQFLRWLAVHPAFWFPVVKWAGKKVWKMRSSLIGARGKVSTLSFIVHNFMDSGSLDRERITACAFKVMTADGPMSMCLHNAKRDSFILLPINIHASGREQTWQPLTGETTLAREAALQQPAPRESRWLKGRNRQRDSAKRRAALS